MVLSRKKQLHGSSNMIHIWYWAWSSSVYENQYLVWPLEIL